jgi:hypothetical protein
VEAATRNVRVPVARVSVMLARDVRDAVARDVLVSIAKKDFSQAIALIVG